MKQNNLKFNIGKSVSKKRRGVAEVISTLLLVVVTVAGAVILTSFLDETFVSGSLSVTSGTDTTIKTIKLIAYDTRNGDDLMGFSPDVLYGLNNENMPAVSGVLCRVTCSGDPDEAPATGGSDFMIISIENKHLNPVIVKNIILDGVRHSFDTDTNGVNLNPGAADSLGGAYPSDGEFSVLSSDTTETLQGNNLIQGGATANLLIKLDTVNDDIELSKTMRVQLNIGESSLADFLIETGDAR